MWIFQSNAIQIINWFKQQQNIFGKGGLGKMKPPSIVSNVSDNFLVIIWFLLNSIIKFLLYKALKVRGAWGGSLSLNEFF